MSNRRMLERLTEIPVAKAVSGLDEYGNSTYDVYHSTTYGFINPYNALSTLTAFGSYLFSAAVLHTQDINFTPDKYQNGANSPTLVDYIYYGNEWWSPSHYVDFSPTTYGKYKQYQITDDRTADVNWKNYSSYFTNPPAYSEITAFEKVVGTLATKMTFKIEPYINNLIEVL